VSTLALVAAAAHAAAAPVEVRPRTTGTSRWLGEHERFLSARSDRRPAAVALDYVRAHDATFRLHEGDLAGLRLVRSYQSGSGAAHLQWEQTAHGIPAFGAGLRANVSDDGRLISIGGETRPDLAVATVEPEVSALNAVLAAARDAGVAVVPRTFGAATGPERSTRFTGGHAAGLTLFPGSEEVRLAWRVLLRADPRHIYDIVVDARTAGTLYRANLVRRASALAFDNYPGAPLGGTQVVKDFPQAGNDPWLTDATRLLGHNAHVYADPSDANQGGFLPSPTPPVGDEIPPSSPGAWSYTQQVSPATSPGQVCPPTPGCSWNNFDTAPPNFSWRVNREQAGTQLFYFINRFHDHLRDAAGIGFDDSSGNFEAGDRVIAQVDDGASTGTGVFDDFPDCSHLNNAHVFVLPDGQPLVMQVYLWSNACTPAAAAHDVNPADDAFLIYHEYSHGLTARLVTDAAGFGGLNAPQSAAMAEGFADWYALDLLNAQGFEPDSPAPGELRAGRYENTTLRTQPFDCPVGATAPACPGTPPAGPGGYTYGDFGKILYQPEVHADGEIWVETLWDLRNRLVADHGAADGLTRARALVTDALRLSGPEPSFLDMRNAVLQADVNRRFGDRDRIWAVFAARGMGERASTNGAFDTLPVEDFTAPPPLPTTSPRDTLAPSVSRFSMSRRRFRVGPRRTARVAAARRTSRGTTFRFRLSERATVRIAIERGRPGRRVAGRCRPAARRVRRRRPCIRYIAVETLVRRNTAAGRRTLSFSGRIGRRALRRGRHRAVITATDAAGNRSRPRALTFTIVRR
jgi:hypothetical protein